ncbi:Cullin [Entophlyctis helioformis]|nr:Cullin [Entophlyctis helioformis]
MNVSRPRPAAKTAIKIASKPRNNTDEQWKVLSDGIREIYLKNASHLSFEELYRNAYNMCLYKSGAQLYSGTRTVIAEHLDATIQQTIVPVFPRSASPPQSEAESFLAAIKAVWDDHTICLGMVRDILMYMDRTYVKTANVPATYDMGMEVFRDVLVRSKTYPVPTHLISTLLHQIRLERDGEVVHRMLLKAMTEMLLTLPVSSSSGRILTTLYDADFERAFLETSQTFLSRESHIMLKECDAMEYLMRAEKRLADEEMRVQHYLHASTEPKIRAIAETELLANHITTIIEMESGFIPAMADDRYQDLHRMYTLFGRVQNGHAELRTALAVYIKRLGSTINETYAAMPPATPTTPLQSTSASTAHPALDAAGLAQPSSSAGSGSSAPAVVKQASPIGWVEAMIGLKDKFDVILDKSFNKDKAFQNEINAALESCVTLNVKSPEFLSLFLDENLRKGIKGKSDEEVETFLDKAIAIFRFVHEKDVFERYYKQHLAKRLLYGRSVSEDTEKNMIAKLKVECGYQFISKLEGMFKDMHVSTDVSMSYRAEQASNTAHGAPELFVHTLTSTFWPITVQLNNTCNFPGEVQSAMDDFQRFYLSLHSGRRLTWLKHMGTADVKATFDKGRKELNVSTYAMAVLLTLFNDLGSNEPVSYERVLAETDVPAPDLKRTLQSLALGKYRVLIKSTKGKDVDVGDSFTVNTAFTSPLNKIKILTVASTGAAATAAAASTSGLGSTNTLETDAERSETLEKIHEHRRHQIEAAIVRVMKSRKVMRHAELVGEVIGQLGARFSPDPVVIKKRIESLIDREYLERDASNRQSYRYLA